jgi:plasmid stabilization system protein ParE
MAHHLAVSTEAEWDILEHSIELERLQEGLSARFDEYVAKAMLEIKRNPLSYQVLHRNIRVHFTEVFSYGVHYVADDKYIRVIAVFHTSQDPVNWENR